MTICFSITDGSRIIAFCDTITELNGEMINDKKFVYLKEARLLLLPYGNFEDVNLKSLKGYDGKHLKRDSILENSEVIHRILNGIIDNIDWELQVCGFDGLTPLIYRVTKNGVDGPHDYLYSGPLAINDFFSENIESLKSLPLDDRKVEQLEQLVIGAIKYENQENKDNPKTGGEAIYSLILSAEDNKLSQRKIELCGLI